MCKFEKNLNRIYTVSGILILIIIVMAMTSCGSSKQCNKTKFHHDMKQWYYQPHIECENCDEID